MADDTGTEPTQPKAEEGTDSPTTPTDGVAEVAPPDIPTSEETVVEEAQAPEAELPPVVAEATPEETTEA
jgi:hypothetical protein